MESHPATKVASSVFVRFRDFSDKQAKKLKNVLLHKNVAHSEEQWDFQRELRCKVGTQVLCFQGEEVKKFRE